jgi:hypothetical protein
MKASNVFKIERLDNGCISEKKRSGYFVAVLKNNICIGTCLTDGTMSAYECYQNVKNNQAIDAMEGNHYAELDRLGL